jgi:SnoaL-like protein
MEGREGIARTIAESVGNAQVLHQLFSYETEVLSPASATSVVSMADMLIRSDGDAVPSHETTAFKTMHGYGHYHGDFVKVAGRWYIKKLVQTRLRMEFTK